MIWAKRELKALHAEHLAGVWVSELAKRRRMRSGDLVSAWQKLGLTPLPRKIGPGRKRRITQAMADNAHADYMAGTSLRECERRYGIRAGTLRTAFVKRGYALRISAESLRNHRKDGTFAPYVPKTKAQIAAIIGAATKLAVPPELAIDWRHWDRARRADFMARLRSKIADPSDRPELPFSANVTPFDYASDEALAIVQQRNRGLGSRAWVTKLDIRSQGVIWAGRLWFWNRQTRCYIEGVRWTPEAGRPVLSRAIYEAANGPIPAGIVIRHRDRNPNNLAPGNLYPATRDEVVRETQATVMSAKSRALTAAILRRSQSNPTNPHEISNRLPQS